MKKRLSVTLMTFMLVLQIISSGFLMPANVFAETNNNAVTAKAETGTNAESEDASIDTKAANQTGEADTKIEQEAKLAVDSLFGSKNYTALAKGVNEWRINSVEVTVEKVTDNQVKKDLQDKIELAKAFLAVNALFTANHQDLANGVTKASIDAANAKVLALVDSEGKNVLKQDIEFAKGKLVETKNTKIAQKKVKTVLSKKSLLQTKSLATGEVNMSSYLSNLQVKDGSGDYAAVNGQTIPVALNSKLSFRADFDFSNATDLGEGSTLVYELPEGTYVQDGLAPIDLIPEGGNTSIGTYSVKKVDGISRLEIVLNANYKTLKGDAKGFITFDSYIGANFDGKSNEYDLTYPIAAGSSAKFTIQFADKKPSPSTTMTKTAAVDKVYNTSKVTYTIDVNKGYANIQNFKLEDNLPAGLKYDSFSVKEYDYNRITGAETEQTTPSVTFIKGGDLTNLEFTASDSITKRYVFTVVATVDNNALVDDGNPDTDTIDKNTATVYDGTTQVQSATTPDKIIIKRANPITKHVKNYDSANQTITWEVYYNFREGTISAGDAVINDYFSTNQSYVDGSLKAYEVTALDSSNNGVTPTFNSSTPISSGDVSVGMTPDSSATLGLPFTTPKGIKISFTNGVNKAYVIQYQTKVDPPVVDGTEKAQNVAYMGANPTSLTTHTDINLSKTLTQGVGVKSNGNINYADKTIDWTITLNTDHTHEMNNVTLTDTFSDTALALIADSVRINGLTVDEYNNSNGTSSDVTSVTPTTDGFTLDFADGNIKHDLTITYKTSFVARDLETKNYHNTLGIAFNGTTKTITTSTHWLSKISQDNGAKSGKYDYTNKQINWTLDINYNQEQLTNAKVVDTIVGQQKYLNNLSDLKVEEMSIDGSGNLQHTDTFLTKDTDYTISAVGESSTFTITFKHSIDKPYRITYSTVPTSKNILTGDNYKNSAQLNEDGGKNTSYAETYPIINGGSISTDPVNDNPTKDTGIIEKTMTRATNSRVLNWTVWVNKSQTAIGNTHFVDKPSDNQTLIRDSIKITPYKYDSNGNLKPNGSPITKDITYDGNTFDIDLRDISSTYKIEYSTYFDGASGDEAGNDAFLKGEGALANKDSSLNNQKIMYNSLSAGLYTSNKAYLTVHKVGAIQGATSGSDILLGTLAGATFELYDDSKTVKLAEGTTNVQGNLIFNRKLSAGIYYLKETALTNQDYNMNSAYIKVEVSSNTIKNVEDGLGTVEQTVKNYLKPEKEPNTCTVTFINKDGNEVLKGSEYKVIKKKASKNDPDVVVVENVQANKDTGKITISKLPAGDYTLVQTKAPTGYDTLAKPKDFTVTDGSCGVTSDIVVKNSKVCNAVTVTFDTVNPSDMTNFRNGAKFKVVDSNGDIAKDKDEKELKDLTLNSDNQLTFNKLPDGEYKIIQTDTPNGYVKIDDITFNTNDLDDECQKTLTVTVEKCDIFANFEVVGATGQQATDLANQAEFKVVDQDGKDVTGATGLKVVNGKVNVPDLSPGTYKLVQTKAPAGYYAASSQTFVVSTDTCTSLIPVKNYQIPSTPTPTCPIEFNVVDSKTNNGIGNATFEIKQNGVTVATATSDAAGKVSLPALPVGDYQLVQMSSKVGYDFSKEPISFSVKNDNGTCSVTISTVKNDPKTCPINITVIDADATNVNVAGATFTIKDKDGKVVEENVTSDQDGHIVVNGLVAGDYTLVQTSVPNGYKKSSDVSFTVKAKEDGSCDNTVVVVKNAPKQCDVVFINKDEDTGKVVQGSSTFIVKDKDNKTITTVTSDSNGKIIVSDLKPGTYQLVQQKAPSGYEEQSGTITFTVKKGECAPTITIENTKTSKTEDPTKNNNTNNGKNNTPSKNNGESTSNNGTKHSTYHVTDKKHVSNYKNDTYKLVDKHGKTVASGLRVNKDGNIVVKGLPDGEYHLVKLPQTGVQTSLFASLMGIILLVLGGYAVYRGRKKNLI